MFAADARTEGFFERVTARPLLTVLLAILAIVLAGAGLGRLVKDTSVKAFIPAGHESLLADTKAAEIFGLSDTIAVAVVRKDGGTIFSSGTLTLIDELSTAIGELDNIRYDRVASIATESSISGEDGAIYIDRYIDDPAHMDGQFVAESRRRWQRMTPHQGTLVSYDESGAVIMAELVDASAADATYLAVLEIVGRIEAEDIELHVAGPGAISGYLSRYIDEDARKLQPLVLVLVLGFIYFAFRRAIALPGPLLVVVGSAAGTLGIMAWTGVPYFAITNALPVIIVAISVADAIHILSAYYQIREELPGLDTRHVVIRAMTMMVRPVTLTTITTVAGFLGIALVSIMPPVAWFAMFAAVGVVLAWALSILVLPNVLLLVDPGRSPAFRTWRDHRPSETGRALAWLGTFSPLRYRSVLIVFLLVAVGAVYGALQLRIDRSQVENFAPDEPIRIADEVINERFAGTAFLDIIVETDEPGGLLEVETMRKMRALQQFFDGLPHVRKSVSIVDYLSHVHGALENLPDADVGDRRLPDNEALLRETLYVYEITGNPADLDEEIDRDYRHALIRGVLDAHYFSQTRLAVEALQRYIDQHFDEPGLSATLTGDVNVSYQWMISLGDAHFKGVVLSLALVLAASIVVFRSPSAGLVSVVPVVFTVLVLYACMGYLGIYLEPATSMFAAIALGVGVDFAIHLVDRLRTATDEDGGDLGRAIDRALPPVARACFFNSAALGMGFAVLLVSDLPTLTRFGGLVALAAFASYLTALVIVPALFAAERDWFGLKLQVPGRSLVPISLLVIAAVIAVLLGGNALAAAPDADAIASAVAAREEGAATRRVIDMRLIDNRGREDLRVAIVHKQTSEGTRMTRITFLEPPKYEDMTFLSYDRRDPGATDARWMYLPANRRVRSIPATRRGDSFFGTVFSFEDVQSELKFSEDDWHFGYEGQVAAGGRIRHTLTGTPRSERIARELGYGGFTAVIDSEMWMPVEVDFVDIRLRPLKSIVVESVSLVDGIWTPDEISAVNHRTGQRTVFTFRDVEYPDAFDERLFDSRLLTRGLHGLDEDD